MTTGFMFAERESAFRMRRPTLMNGNFVTDLDEDVRARLDELEQLLGKAVLTPEGVVTIEVVTEPDTEDGPSPDDDDAIFEKESAETAATGTSRGSVARSIKLADLLAMALSPWRPKSGSVGAGWPNGSLVNYLSKAEDNPALLRIADVIDVTPDLSNLKYDMQVRIDSGKYAFDANTRAVLQDHPAIQDYLIARAYHVGGLREPKALFNYLIGNRAGAKSIIDYLVVSAARTYIDRKRLKVGGYQNDTSAFVKKLKAKPIALADDAFDKAVHAVINDVMYNADASSLVDGSKIGPTIPAALRPRVISYVKSSPIPITAANVDLFLPTFVARAAEFELDLPAEDEEEGFAIETEDRSYKVQFRGHADVEDDVDRMAVRYAAQLFHAMVVGEELGVFDAFQYLLHSRMLIGGGMQVRDRKLRADLKLYALANEFRDLSLPGQPTEERTRASERKMFARQVFAQGDGRLIEGMEENVEFRQLWHVLMIESARFLERAQESFNPGSFVSKQNVMQAVEDLQYNLSTHCVGWPQVMAPAVDAELNFVLSRFVENDEIADQVLPTGGSWMRVVDKLNAERPKKAPIAGAALLYAKATQGMEILYAIADYSPAAFEDDREFSSFIGLVDAYITTESKLQSRRGRPRYDERMKPPLDEEPEEEEVAAPEEDAELAAAEGDDDWDF